MSQKGVLLVNMENSQVISKSFKTDLVGIFSASLCTIHCLAAPILLALFASEDWFHAATYLFLMLSIYAAYSSTKHTAQRWLKALIWSSLALLAVAIIFEDTVEWFHELSYLASAGLIIGHLLNLRSHQHQHAH